ncbi:hypothetical protein [Aureispira sp. CCB-QB1]|uniref:hypothetical protein n=1 Tax=Aureispira sp. CCB-QB1 TaxID=1313421 RepID=UPI000695C18E|nr:hypothetical protein [Aureispira sp. CCB-QB1]
MYIHSLSIFLSSILVVALQACTSKNRIPVCEFSEATHYEYSTSDNKLSFLSSLSAFVDYDAGIACAQRQNKPVFLAFTGFGSRMRYFPDVVIQQRAIVNYLTNDFVPIILYVDDRQRIPKEEVETATGVKELRTVGNYNAYLQEIMFGVMSQPYMALMTWEGELLTEPMGYRPDPTDYVQAFEVAIENFRKREASNH